MLGKLPCSTQESRGGTENFIFPCFMCPMKATGNVYLMSSHWVGCGLGVVLLKGKIWKFLNKLNFSVL